MTKQFAVVVTMLVLVSAFAGLGIQNACASGDSGDSGIEIVAFSSDKDLYSANEEMTVFLSVYSPENVSNTLIKVSGVKSTKGVVYVAYSSPLNLTVGENNVTFTKKLPSCSRCAGISQGTYVIDASVTYGDEVVTAKHSIAITSTPDQTISVNIAVDEVNRLIASESDDIIVVDIRTKDEYDAGHIEGALSVPISELSNRTEEFNTSTKIVVYSANGSNSTIVCDILIKNGSARVYNVVGGLDAWNESGYTAVPTTTSNPMAPGFEAVLALVAVLFVAYRVRRR
ncbi:MAG TPA: rhodanese-like domain-containing protein [Desulfobacteria bacterium]|nr:rhodanese-like domain-containing protein [Desulfobacteria bacterium]